MAAKRAKAKTSSQTTTKVTRISASDNSSGTKKPALKKPTLRAKAEKSRQQTAQTSTNPASPKRRGPLRAIKDYFVGAWHELREVRWPTRRATWGMTGALLAFTAFFVVVISLLDSGFQYVFKLLIGQ